MANATVAGTPIFDELRELFGQLEIEELIGRSEEGAVSATQAES
ncbi:hypothetical protein [Kibdelosporangium phytohabitans]|nr:hypothetical protein [Kibdelosporangium phytohabitans]MBE1464268.1 hypothetical protein [Kibdelosporangium phytohabitans]